MTRYYIREWDQRYEVNSKGHALHDRFPRRAGPLEFVRLKVYGRSLGMGWRKLIQVAGVREAPAVFGIFCKLLEIAADAKRDERGYVDDSPEEPLAFVLGLDREQVANALAVLSSPALRWLVCEPEDSSRAHAHARNTTQLNSTQLNVDVTNQPTAGNSGNRREFRETPGIPGIPGNDYDHDDRPLSRFGELVAFWNTFGPEPVKEAELISLEPRYVALVTGVPPNRFSHEEIMAAMENYKRAREFPGSQTHPHSLGKFLVNTALLTKFLPGVFNLPDHDGTRFNKKGNERDIPKEVEEYRERKQRFLSGQ